MSWKWGIDSISCPASKSEWSARYRQAASSLRKSGSSAIGISVRFCAKKHVPSFGEKKDCAQNQEEENRSPDPFFRRMSRGLFGILFIALWILGIIIFGIIKDTYGADSAGTNVVVALILLTSLYLFIRRLHDLNRPAWLSVLAIVPYINLILLVYLLFFKGTSGPNRFGADPLEQQNAVPAQPDAID